MSLNPLSSGSLGVSSILGGRAVGTNPLNPLQGQSALTGIGQFVKDLESKAALRKAGKLPSTKKPTLANAAALQGAGGAGGGMEALVALLQQLMATLSAKASG